jgi:hypothetical protein
MRYRKLDENDDYSFGQGQINFYKDDPVGVAQAVLTRLRLWLTEWFLDIEEGMPWVQGVLGKREIETANNTIRTHVLETEGVLRIVDYNSQYDADNRTFSVQIEMDTIYGPETIIEVL